MPAFGLSGKLPNGTGCACRGQFNWLHQAIQSITEWFFERLSWCLASNVNMGRVCSNSRVLCVRAATAEPKLCQGLELCVGAEAE